LTPDGPRYRGHLAVQLAQNGAGFERVAELLWTGLWHDQPLRWRVAPQAAEVRKLAGSIAAPQTSDQLLETFAVFTLRLGIAAGNAAEREHSGKTLSVAKDIIHTLTGCFGYLSKHRSFQAIRNGESTADGLLRSLAIDDTEENRAGLQAILILLADHELSPGALAARVAASSGAALHSCITSAICAISGIHVGRLYDPVETFLARASTKAILLRRAEKKISGTRHGGARLWPPPVSEWRPARPDSAGSGEAAATAIQAAGCHLWIRQ
jgi:citrate synthase